MAVRRCLDNPAMPALKSSWTHEQVLDIVEGCDVQWEKLFDTDFWLLFCSSVSTYF